MALYDSALVRLIWKFQRARVRQVNAVVLHVSASNSESLFRFFSGAVVCSHFHVSKAGKVEQYLDTDWASSADLEGNQRVISIETQGVDGEPWTEAQLVALAKLLAWIGQAHNIPLRLAENSRTTTDGIAWHRLGVDGNFPSVGLLAGRTQRGGGEKWSLSRGKVCPGDERIKQIPGLVQQATLIGQTTIANAKEWDEMATRDEIKQAVMEVLGSTDIAGAVWTRDFGGQGKPEDIAWWILKNLQNSLATLSAQNKAILLNLEKNGVDPAIIEKSIKEALADIEITLKAGN